MVRVQSKISKVCLKRYHIAKPIKVLAHWSYAFDSRYHTFGAFSVGVLITFFVLIADPFSIVFVNRYPLY